MRARGIDVIRGVAKSGRNDPLHGARAQQRAGRGISRRRSGCTRQQQGDGGSLFRRTVALLPTVNFPYRRLGDRVLPDAVVSGPTAPKVEIDLHGILAEGGRRLRQAQRQSGN